MCHSLIDIQSLSVTHKLTDTKTKDVFLYIFILVELVL